MDQQIVNHVFGSTEVELPYEIQRLLAQLDCKCAGGPDKCELDAKPEDYQPWQ